MFLFIMKDLCYNTGYDRDPNEQLTTFQRNSWPSANGVVLDAETKKPIDGAQVVASAHFTGMFWTVGDVKEASTQTDEQGRYKLPALRYFGYVNSASYEQTIYKARYVVYCSRGCFKKTIPQKKFTFKDNVVLLEKWDDTKYTPHDHVDHVQSIGCHGISPYSSEKGKIFCREAREEMILGCMDIGSKYPRRRELCEEIVDESLGLTPRKERKQ